MVIANYKIYGQNKKNNKMKHIPTFIVNLERDTERRKYVLGILKDYDFLSLNLVPAIEGARLSSQEVEERFDTELAFKRYGRYLNRGEIGCTLSHYECYKKLMSSDSRFALIVEDDITILRSLKELEAITTFVDTEIPVILFLSGDFWYTSKKKLVSGNYITNVYDAVGSYAYLINKSAASLILERNTKASCAADNWSLYRSQGVQLKAICPYMIDANIEEFTSTINQSYFGENRQQMPLKYRFRAYWLALIKKILVFCGHFVSKIRRSYNEVN